jgi:hypothetical protein
MNKEAITSSLDKDVLPTSLLSMNYKDRKEKLDKFEYSIEVEVQASKNV